MGSGDGGNSVIGAPVWVTVNVCPAMVRLAVRVAVVVLAATV